MNLRPLVSPTTVVDRNGRVTTVHKKGSTSPSSSLSSVPPASVDHDEKHELISSLTERLTAAAYGPGRAARITNILLNFPIELLRRFDACPYENEPSYKLLSQSLKFDMTHGTASEHLAFFGLVQTPQLFFAEKRVAALHHYKQLPVSDDFASESHEVIKKCEALLTVTGTCMEANMNVFHKGEPFFVLKDDALVDLIVEHPDQAVRITDFIKERRYVDSDILRELIDGEAAALGHGAL